MGFEETERDAISETKSRWPVGLRPQVKGLCSSFAFIASKWMLSVIALEAHLMVQRCDPWGYIA